MLKLIATYIVALTLVSATVTNAQTSNIRELALASDLSQDHSQESELSIFNDEEKSRQTTEEECYGIAKVLETLGDVRDNGLTIREAHEVLMTTTDDEEIVISMLYIAYVVGEGKTPQQIASDFIDECVGVKV